MDGHSFSRRGGDHASTHTDSAEGGELYGWPVGRKVLPCWPYQGRRLAPPRGIGSAVMQITMYSSRRTDQQFWQGTLSCMNGHNLVPDSQLNEQIGQRQQDLPSTNCDLLPDGQISKHSNQWPVHCGDLTSGSANQWWTWSKRNISLSGFFEGHFRNSRHQRPRWP
jgi:hypothetical protein